MTTNPNTTRRAVLAGTAESDDPAIAAAWRWIAARERETAYNTLAAGSCDWEDDAQAVAISAECERCYDAMISTTPTTAEGATLMFMADLFDRDGTGRGCRFGEPESWGLTADSTKLRDTIWNSPVAAKLLRKGGAA